MYCKRSRFQAQQGDCPFYPPCRGVASGLGHPGDNVHSIVILYNILYMYILGNGLEFRYTELYSLCVCIQIYTFMHTQATPIWTANCNKRKGILLNLVKQNL